MSRIERIMGVGWVGLYIHGDRICRAMGVISSGSRDRLSFKATFMSAIVMTH